MMIAHFSDKPVSAAVPSPFGPRCSGQSPSATRRGPCAATEIQRHKTTATGSHEFFSIATSSRRNRDSRKQLMHPPSAQVARRSVYTKAPEPLRPRDGAAEMTQSTPTVFAPTQNWQMQHRSPRESDDRRHSVSRRGSGRTEMFEVFGV